jgi:tetratricopeptide (TPR) repeat protein
LRALLVALVAALLAGAPTLARGAGDDAAQAKAKARIKKARQYYEAQKFDQAIAEYSAAYKLVAAPDILFNIATIFEVKGDNKRALQFYLKYLEVEPEGRLAGDARSRAEERAGDLLSDDALKAKYTDALGKTTPEARAADPAWKTLLGKIASGDEAIEDAILQVTPKPKAKPKPVLEEREAVATVVEAPPPKPRRAPRPVPPLLKKWWFWTAVGGGAAVVLAIGLGAGLASGASDPQATLGVLR